MTTLWRPIAQTPTTRPPTTACACAALAPPPHHIWCIVFDDFTDVRNVTHCHLAFSMVCSLLRLTTKVSTISTSSATTSSP